MLHPALLRCQCAQVDWLKQKRICSIRSAWDGQLKRHFHKTSSFYNNYTYYIFYMLLYICIYIFMYALCVQSKIVLTFLKPCSLILKVRHSNRKCFCASEIISSLDRWKQGHSPDAAWGYLVFCPDAVLSPVTLSDTLLSDIVFSEAF